MLVFGLLVFQLAVAVLAAPPAVDQGSSSASFLLPKTTVPVHYDLHLNINPLNKEGFSGTVAIDIDVVEWTRSIVMHSMDLEIDQSKTLVTNRQKVFNVSQITADLENRMITFELNGLLAPGKYVFKTAFTGIYYNFEKGLFLSAYDKNEDKYMVVTQLEPILARHVFPCYDEPNLKATFRISVTFPITHSAVSNSPIQKYDITGNSVTTTFEKTSKMSTYVLALAVSDYEYVETKLNGKPIRIFVPPGETEKAHFALNTTVDCIRSFENILKVNYTLPKLDSIIVNAFGGGMENWGLIVYGSSILFTLNESTPLNIITSHMNLICHEVAHQWFGNLVTLDWWDYVWLNEGFATHYAQRGADMINPSYRFMINHVGDLVNLMKSDSVMKNSKSLNCPATYVDEFMAKFGSIGYNKGSAIVRFMSSFFNGFDEGITSYLNNFKYGNTRPSDLFDVINEKTELPFGATVHKIMENWVNMEGYPLISLKTLEHQGNMSVVEISQERFTINGEKRPEKWWIPITMAIEKSPNFDNLNPAVWLRDEAPSIVVNFERFDDGWVILNLQRAVFARVNYDTDNWNRIIDYLNGPDFETIHVLNRVALIDDAKALVDSQKLSDSVLLNLLSYLKHERDPLVKRVGERVMKQLKYMLQDTAVLPKYKKFATEILGKDLSSEIFKAANLKSLVKEAFAKINENKNQYNSALGDLDVHVYSEKDVAQVLMTVRSSYSQSEMMQQKEFIDDLKIRAANNKMIKERFAVNNFAGIKEWFDSHY